MYKRQGLPDTVMTLYDVDGTTELLENDDTDVGRESYLMWTCPASGRYGVRVRAYDDTQTGGTGPQAPVVESQSAKRERVLCAQGSS